MTKLKRLIKYCIGYLWLCCSQ